LPWITELSYWSTRFARQSHVGAMLDEGVERNDMHATPSTTLRTMDTMGASASSRRHADTS